MLKLKPSSSLLRAFTITTGEDSFISLAAKLRINNSINLLSARALSCTRTFPQSLHSSTSEDDDCSELGSPVPKPLSNPRKLMTEKPEPYRKTDRSRKSFGMPSESSISLKDDSSKLESTSRTSLAGEDVVKDSDLPIFLPDHQEEITIRITNINSDTTVSAVHTVCMSCVSCGSLEGLVRTKEDSVDALFSVKDNRSIQRIVKKLNQTIVNDHKWSANLHPRDSAPEVMSKQSDANCNLGVHMSSHLGDLRRRANCTLGLDISSHLAQLRRQIAVKTVCIEDLDYLHSALLYLEAHPPTNGCIPDND